MIGLITLALWLAPPHPPPVGLPISVEAAPQTACYAKCHIRTFHAAVGGPNYGTEGFVNTYVIDSHGAFHDRIPSPNAQCVFGKLKGPGPVTLHIFKDGDHALKVDKPNQWFRLLVW